MSFILIMITEVYLYGRLKVALRNAYIGKARLSRCEMFCYSMIDSG